jgi:hypothetical protein
MKSSWDEQEFIFLIAIGSIICSVFYISVLIKRYPIIISIEKLIAEINKAKMWNNREENLHNNKIETGFITKFNKDGSMPVAFQQWGTDYPDYRKLPIFIHEEVYRSGWRLFSWNVWRTGRHSQQ